jgi:putative aminopeptidase FrvX
MRAADDLAGCAAILAALESLVNTPTTGTVFGLFTRAEEVGGVGAQLAAENELFPKDTIVVSVETSSVLPGAEIGEGVVIRTGDRAATFDYEAEVYLAEASKLSDTQSLEPHSRSVRGTTGEKTELNSNSYRRTILSGARC